MADHTSITIDFGAERYGNSLANTLSRKLQSLSGQRVEQLVRSLFIFCLLIEFFLIRCRDEVQQPQHPHQQQQGWLDWARKLHVLFGLLKLLILPGSHSPYIICEVINLILLIAMMRSACPHWVYWYLYVGSGILGFELLLWMNLPLEAWLVINMCLLVYALESSGLLARGSDQLLRLIQPLDDAPFSEVQFDV